VSYFDDHEDELINRWAQQEVRPPRCKYCGSADVRWRQQTGKWVLFSLQPGVEHTCSAEDLANDFD